MSLREFEAYRRAVAAGIPHDDALDDVLDTLPVGIVIGGSMRRRVEGASAGTGLSVPEILQVGLRKIVAEFETLGRIEIVACGKGGAL